MQEKQSNDDHADPLRNKQKASKQATRSQNGEYGVIKDARPSQGRKARHK
jgi:hypothetical protein